MDIFTSPAEDINHKRIYFLFGLQLSRKQFQLLKSLCILKCLFKKKKLWLMMVGEKLYICFIKMDLNSVYSFIQSGYSISEMN
jgi:hypothetical protein